MTVNFKTLSKLATVPTRGSDSAAGYDLYAAIEDTIWIEPHTTVKIPTDIAVELPSGTFGAVFARSGLATKQGLRPANAVGVIDPDYRGNCIVALHNDSNVRRLVEPGDRIAQLVIIPFISVEFNQMKELSDTERGEGGFGSTGH